MKGINPLWITIASAIVTIDSGIGSGTVKLDHVFPTDWLPWVVGWAGFLAFIGGVVVTTLTTLTSNATGMFIKDPGKAVMIAALALGSLLAFPGDAHAQSILKPLRPLSVRAQVAAPVAAATPAATADPLAKLVADIENVKGEIITGTIVALNEADADAATLTSASDPSSFHDPISHACYPAEIKFLQSLPVVAQIQSPSPFNLIVLFQRKRDLIMQIQAGLPSYLKLGCAALLGDEASIFTKTMGLIGVTVGANLLLPGSGLALPVLP